jgi:hypothetical protein
MSTEAGNKIWAICFVEQGTGETPIMFFSNKDVAIEAYSKFVQENDKHDKMLFEYYIYDHLPDEDDIYDCYGGYYLI